MNIKDFILMIVSRIVASIGMTLGTISMIYSLYCFFFSANPYRFILGGASIVAFLIAYGLYKFALKYIYDEWEHYR
ncbi:hypothetical protein STN0717ENT73_32750 [Enterobacter cloacae]|nr:hypothetical protein P852_03030 [Enterobacter asburiae]BBW46961.1 hypothetical protein STN0717ENT73_32750 [Enterobacter cloacae]BBZ88586.1 hypothetical protein EAA2563_32010 [Enterobacter asburiae]BCP71144.1 hypothetical protein R1N_33310 [Enterobacter asburiae]